MALQIDDDETFYRANWIAERAGWVGLFLFIVAGLAGALGRGPLTVKSVQRDAVRVTYDRVMRRSSPGTISINVAPGTKLDTLVYVIGDRSLLDACHPQQIIPEPAQVIDASTTQSFAIRVAPNRSSTLVTIACDPERVGRFSGRLGLENGPNVPIRILVLP